MQKILSALTLGMLIAQPVVYGATTIYSTAYNSANAGIKGGTDGTNAYAALIAPGGAITALPVAGDSLPAPGFINSVAINAAGECLIGGRSTLPIFPYAAFVSPTGYVTNLHRRFSVSGEVTNVALADSGAGLLMGFAIVENNENYSYPKIVAVSPSGVITDLPPDWSEKVFFDQLSLDDLLSGLTPKSIGPYASAIYSQLAASEALEMRFAIHSRELRSQPSQNISWLAARQIPSCPCDHSGYTFWAEPFGNYIHLKRDRSFPTFTNEIAGMLTGFDYETQNLLLGGGIGYAFNYIHYSESQGHGKINEELGCFYSSYKMDPFWINGAIWGGGYQLDNIRHTYTSITSQSHPHGWVLSPHFEFGGAWDFGFILEPFVRLNWTNAWQAHYSENGSSDLNLVIDSQYASLLQSEAGLRFFETLHYGWGRCLLEQKLSYVNLAPFHFEKAQAYFIDSISTFPIATGSSKLQNLGSLQFILSFLPNADSLYGTLDLGGQFGSSFQSYFASVQMGKSF